MARVVRVPVSGLRAGECELDREASHYLVTVQRLRAGAEFIGFDPERAVEAKGSLLDANSRRARCRFAALASSAPVIGVDVTLVQAIGKGEKMELVVRDATALGAARVVMLSSERSVVRVGDDRRDAKIARLHKVAVEAARQSGRADIPVLAGPCSLPEALHAVEHVRTKLCFDPAATVPVLELLERAAPVRSVALLIGPEGGLTGSEVEQAIASGFVAARLGPYVLRTETAATAALGVVLAFSGGARSEKDVT